MANGRVEQVLSARRPRKGGGRRGERWSGTFAVTSRADHFERPPSPDQLSLGGSDLILCLLPTEKWHKVQ